MLVTGRVASHTSFVPEGDSMGRRRDFDIEGAALLAAIVIVIFGLGWLVLSY